VSDTSPEHAPLFRVKICGITTPDDARLVVEAAGHHAASGTIAIGVNFVAGSPRAVGLDAARAIRDATPEGIACVGVFAGADVAAMKETAVAVGLDAIQLHGPLTSEELLAADPPERCRELAPTPVIRAARLEAEGLSAARAWLAHAVAAGAAPAMMLVDAAVARGTPAGRLGGSGETVDWKTLAREEPLHVAAALAGGLTADNVERAVREARGAFAIDAVDTASGVERRPGVKDPAKVGAFIAAALRALAAG
jgi:phosphoribosylanthranilate isomerase